MTIDEYRQKHPDCEYCQHRLPPFENCRATSKRMSKRTAKKCPCYFPEKWDYEVEGRMMNSSGSKGGGE